MKILIASIILISSISIAQTELKLVRPVHPRKVKFCIHDGKKFEIKNIADQETCDLLKKGDPKGNIIPPKPPVATPNPITAPPTE